MTKKKKTTQPAHSVYGASSMDRIINCPKSVAMAKGLKSIDSDHSIEGTKGHDCVEWVLINAINKKMQTKSPKRFAKLLKATASKKHWNDEMVLHALSVAEWVSERMKTAPDVELYCELKLDSSKFTQKGQFGTSDIILFSRSKRWLESCDYKYGAGVTVEIEDNVQIQYYALAALLKFGWGDFDKVVTTVFQPRIEHPQGPVRSVIEKRDNFIKYGKKIKSAVKFSQSKEAFVKAGKWCQFCPAKFKCPEFNASPFKELKEEGVDLAPIIGKKEVLEFKGDIGKMLEAADKLAQLVKSIRIHAYREAIGGKKVNGFKLVSGRTTRFYTDPVNAEESAKELFGKKVFTSPELISPAQFEKKFKGNKKALKWLNENISSKTGSVNLVKASDRRKEVNLATEAFDDEFDYLAED